ncbi:MAG: helix-turn-helix domain-containing protein [Balneolaceae bacterium]
MHKKSSDQIYHEIKERIENDRLYMLTDLRRVKRLVAAKWILDPCEVEQIVREKLNMTFAQWLNSYRIDRAKELLGDPQYESEKIVDIAWKTGFNNLSDFQVHFRKCTECTPGEYRAFHMNFRKVMGISPAEYRLEYNR